jgi:hypothetical protein
MTEQEKDIDMITSGWLKKLQPEDPSEEFSRKVMDSVYALRGQKQENHISLWWLLLLLPVLAAGVWYLYNYTTFMDQVNGSWMNIRNYYNSLNSNVGDFFLHMKKVTISPFVILIFLAALSLLLIEDIFSKNRNKQNSEVLKY